MLNIAVILAGGSGQRAGGGIPKQFKKGGIRMNPNADYLGIVTMLRSLREQGLVSGSEAKKIAARLRVQLGADIIISL